jgi:hypothetical protein
VSHTGRRHMMPRTRRLPITCVCRSPFTPLPFDPVKSPLDVDYAPGA